MRLASTPCLESRSAADIVDYVARRTAMPMDGSDPFGEGLLRIFARYCEIIIERLNCVPDKHFMSYLNSIGAQQILPTPAQVPVTFMPIKRPALASSPAVIASGTKVLSTVTSDGEPVIYETRSALDLVNAELQKLVAVDPRTGCYCDLSGCLMPEGPPQGMTSPTQTLNGEFFIRQDDSFAAIQDGELHIQFDLVRSGLEVSGRSLVWSIPTDKEDIELKPLLDSTQNLTRSGVLTFSQLPIWPDAEIHGRSGKWLRCKLISPPLLHVEDAPHENSTSISRIRIQGKASAQAAQLEQAFFNGFALDVSKEFFPFGESPRFGDTFYLASPLFGLPQSEITLNVTVINPVSGDGIEPHTPNHQEHKPRLRWEAWSGDAWVILHSDGGSNAFTKSGSVHLVLPEKTAIVAVNGRDAYWLRVRLVNAGYHHLHHGSIDGSKVLAPCIGKLTLDSRKTLETARPNSVVVRNNLEARVLDGDSIQNFYPFPPLECNSNSLYIGIRATAASQLVERQLTFYAILEDVQVSRVSIAPDVNHASLSAQCWTVGGWQECRIRDETSGLTLSGGIVVELGENVEKWQNATVGADLYWVRLLHADDRAGPIAVRHLSLNTTLAQHVVTLENEILGTSNGRPSQIFRAARAPMLGDVELQVREPSIPSDIGSDKENVTVTRDAKGAIREIWIKWREVRDIESCDKRDRSFCVDRQTGTIYFGDGVHGLIPPSGANNIRLRRYRIGGGRKGNQPAQSIKQLRSPAPYVAAVTNHAPACGGEDLESWESVTERGATWLRNGGRAVTVEDYEDLARQASPSIGRAKCYASLNLVTDPVGSRLCPGSVSVVIVPRSLARQPTPTQQQVSAVHQFLSTRQLANLELIVVPPTYAPLAVEAEVCAKEGLIPSELVAICESRIEEFLHPTFGAQQKSGWQFGELPAQSDLQAALESVPGVDHVRHLSILTNGMLREVLASGIYLVCAGIVRVTVKPSGSSL
jgi:Baseplate J-like protein